MMVQYQLYIRSDSGTERLEDGCSHRGLVGTVAASKKQMLQNGFRGKVECAGIAFEFSGIQSLEGLRFASKSFDAVEPLCACLRAERDSW